MNDLYWMRQAWELAVKAQQENEVPVGAVLVDGNQRLLGQGYNRVLQCRDPTAHAEMIAVREAALALGNHRLLNTSLYVTLEPCAMCAGTLVHARIGRLVFATRDFKAGAAGSVFNLAHNALLNHKIQIDEGIMQQECASLLSDFFAGCRV